jgi:hypothetical protein
MTQQPLYGSHNPHLVQIPREIMDKNRSLKTISEAAYQYPANNFFKREGIEFIVRSSQIKFFVVNIDEQEIVQWLN